MSDATKMRVAAVQMSSTADVAENLRVAERLTAEAVAQGARLVLLPENFGLMGRTARDKIAAQEPDGEGPQQRMLARAAQTHGIFTIGGSVPIACGEADRTKQSLLVYGPDGTRVTRYDKIHLFRFTHGEEDYDEAKTIVAGAEAQGFAAPCGRVGLSICYDLRFPELYRLLGDVALIVVPAAFTARTGEAHWETLLRARAIENQCYVLAAAQCGMHAGGRRTFGHSMLVDPWGVVIARRDEGAGVVIGDVDPARIRQVRASLPALDARTL